MIDNGMAPFKSVASRYTDWAIRIPWLQLLLSQYIFVQEIRNNVLYRMKLIKVKQSHYRPDLPRGFQEVKVPRLCSNGTGWW